MTARRVQERTCCQKCSWMAYSSCHTLRPRCTVHSKNTLTQISLTQCWARRPYCSKAISALMENICSETLTFLPETFSVPQCRLSLPLPGPPPFPLYFLMTKTASSSMALPNYSCSLSPFSFLSLWTQSRKRGRDQGPQALPSVGESVLFYE